MFLFSLHGHKKNSRLRDMRGYRGSSGIGTHRGHLVACPVLLRRERRTASVDISVISKLFRRRAPFPGLVSDTQEYIDSSHPGILGICSSQLCIAAREISHVPRMQTEQIRAWGGFLAAKVNTAVRFVLSSVLFFCYNSQSGFLPSLGGLPSCGSTPKKCPAKAGKTQTQTAVLHRPSTFWFAIANFVHD